MPRQLGVLIYTTVLSPFPHRRVASRRVESTPANKNFCFLHPPTNAVKLFWLLFLLLSSKLERLSLFNTSAVSWPNHSGVHVSGPLEGYAKI